MGDSEAVLRAIPCTSHDQDGRSSAASSPPTQCLVLPGRAWAWCATCDGPFSSPALCAEPRRQVRHVRSHQEHCWDRGTVHIVTHDQRGFRPLLSTIIIGQPQCVWRWPGVSLSIGQTTSACSPARPAASQRSLPARPPPPARPRRGHRTTIRVLHMYPPQVPPFLSLGYCRTCAPRVTHGGHHHNNNNNNNNNKNNQLIEPAQAMVMMVHISTRTDCLMSESTQSEGSQGSEDLKTREATIPGCRPTAQSLMISTRVSNSFKERLEHRRV